MDQEIINRIAAIDFNHVFVIDDIQGKQYTYNSFFSIASSISDYIEENVPGTSIVAIKENSIDLALLYFGVMLGTKEIQVIDPQKGTDEIANILSHLKDTSIILDNDSDIEVEARHTVLNPNFREWKQIDNVKEYIIKRLGERASNTPYLVTYTSGTSGNTKGVAHTAENLFLTALALDEKVKKRRGTFLHVMPMTYMAGILNSIIYPFLCRSEIVITKRFSIMTARKFWDTVIKYRADFFWLSPSMLSMIDQLDRKNKGEEYCKGKNLVFLVGTAPLTNEVREKFNTRYATKVYTSYGLSETLFVSIETPDSAKVSDINSVGELLNGVKYKITDVGEMLLDVPWMFCGYTNENTAEYFDGGFYKTGDLAEVRNNCLYITGRLKDLIIKGGMNISPLLVENTISKIDGILENSVVGVKDSSGEEKICCVYRCDAIDKVSDKFENNLRKSVIQKLGKNYALDYLWRVQEIPRNINGKIDKNKIKELWEMHNGKQD